MGKKAIIGAVVLLALLLAAILFVVGSKQPAQVITVRYVNSVHSSNSVELIFELTNHTTRTYNFGPIFSVEVHNGKAWKEVVQSRSFQHPPWLNSHVFRSFTVQATNLPVGSPLRLRMFVGTEAKGPELLLRRWELRILRGVKNLSLNPFDKNSSFHYGKTIPILSDEFTVPEQK